jgi:hypothetical protein
MSEKEMLEQVLEQAKQAVVALPAWKKTMLRRTSELPRAQGPWLRVSLTQLGKSLSALARGRRLNSFLF